MHLCTMEAAPAGAYFVLASGLEISHSSASARAARGCRVQQAGLMVRQQFRNAASPAANRRAPVEHSFLKRQPQGFTERWLHINRRPAKTSDLQALAAQLNSFLQPVRARCWRSAARRILPPAPDEI